MPVPASEIKFSILMLSIPERIESMTAAVKHLQEQADAVGQGKAVEILVLLDNRSKSISEKRNDLLQIARGKYIAFLDDDDAVSKEYMAKILTAIDTHDGIDCISFNQWCSIDGEPMDVEFAIGNPHGQLWRDEDGFLGNIKRPPYHMCFWRNKIAKNVRFRPSSYGEDLDWISRMLPYVTSETHLDKVLHQYRYSDATSESIQYANNNC
jgi:glycosyltransferase involved in cell wall biosynthesis